LPAGAPALPDPARAGGPRSASRARALLAVILCLALVALALLASGCGAHRPRPAALRVERADLVLLAGMLERRAAPVQAEVAAARAVWPGLAPGLPRAPAPSAATRRVIATAAARARAVVLAPLLVAKGSLTGPAAQIGEYFKSYLLLTQRGWRTLAAAVPVRGRAASAGGRAFLRANAGLYIYCVYDGHYDLSLVGKKLGDAYDKLGGAAAFGRALTPGRVAALEGVYAIGAVRLQPHPGAGVRV
jgi:hypothetical protein